MLTSLRNLAILALAGAAGCAVAAAETPNPAPAPKEVPMVSLCEFRGEADASQWYVIDDSVMGGVSASRFLPGEDGSGIFRGNLSLENNGGFCSSRSRPMEFDLTGCDGIAVRVRGDGRKYAFNLRTDSRFNGLYWHQPFETRAGEWTEIRLPFDRFRARIMGTEMPSAGNIDPAAIRTLGFIISDKKEGPFELEIDWIRAYRADEKPAAEAAGSEPEAPPSREG